MESQEQRNHSVSQFHKNCSDSNTNWGDFTQHQVVYKIFQGSVEQKYPKWDFIVCGETEFDSFEDLISAGKNYKV